MPQQQIDYDKVAAEVQGIDLDALAQEVGGVAASHEPPTEKPVATGGGRGTALSLKRVGQVAKDYAPAIGAGLAVAAAPTGFLTPIAAAGLGGYVGSRLRGDAPGDAGVEAIKQGSGQGAGNAAGGILKFVGRGFMKGAIPKGIQQEFGGRKVAQAALDEGAIPGSEVSAKRIGRLSHEANTARDTAAASVPPLSRRQVLAGIKPIHQEAVKAREPEIAGAVLDYMRTTARNIGPTGMSGAEQLARKSVKQRIGRAATNAENPKTAAVIPQVADAERDAIMRHLHETPEMKAALDRSQKLMGLDRFMQDSLTSNMASRAGGGVANVMRSPMGMGVTGHALNTGGKGLQMSPQALRMLAVLKALTEQE